MFQHGEEHKHQNALHCDTFMNERGLALVSGLVHPLLLRLILLTDFSGYQSHVPFVPSILGFFLFEAALFLHQKRPVDRISHYDLHFARRRSHEIMQFCKLAELPGLLFCNSHVSSPASSSFSRMRNTAPFLRCDVENPRPHAKVEN